MKQLLESILANDEELDNRQVAKPKDIFELRKLIADAVDKTETYEEVDLNFIDVSGLTSLNRAFHNVSNVNKYKFNVSDWKVSNCKDFDALFVNCEIMNCDFSKWDVRNAETMESMFKDCKSFEGKGLDKWNPKNCENMRSMFEGCKREFTGKGLENWDTSSCKDMKEMFKDCEYLDERYIKDWKTQNVANMDSMFKWTGINITKLNWDFTKILHKIISE